MNGNAYYKKLVAGSQRLYFFDGRNVDIFTNTMQSTGAIRTPLIVDVAASDTNAFTIQNNLTVTSYGRDGNALATSTINESSDLPPVDHIRRRRGLGLDRHQLPEQRLRRKDDRLRSEVRIRADVDHDRLRARRRHQR